jgi:hypothetical protein
MDCFLIFIRDFRYFINVRKKPSLFDLNRFFIILQNLNFPLRSPVIVVGIDRKIVSTKFGDGPGLLDKESISLVLDKPHSHGLVHA